MRPYMLGCDDIFSGENRVSERRMTGVVGARVSEESVSTHSASAGLHSDAAAKFSSGDPTAHVGSSHGMCGSTLSIVPDGLDFGTA